MQPTALEPGRTHLARPRFSVYIATSVDGYIAAPDDGLAWLERVSSPGEDYGYAAFMDTVDTLVIGRRTHDVVARFAAWPYGDRRVVVMTHRPLTALHGEEAFAGDPTELSTRLAAAGARRVYLDGGAVVRQFLDAGLVDDLTLSVVPIVLGAGIRLWADHGQQLALDLEAAQSYASGLVQLRYRRMAA